MLRAYFYFVRGVIDVSVIKAKMWNSCLISLMNDKRVSGDIRILKEPLFCTVLETLSHKNIESLLLLFIKRFGRPRIYILVISVQLMSKVLTIVRPISHMLQ